MALYFDLPIYKHGCDLLALALEIQTQLPRVFKRSMGEKIHDLCMAMLEDLAMANGSRGDKRILQAQLHARVTEPFWRTLADTVLMHDPRTDYELRGDPGLLQRVPPHKRLLNAPADTGLPIGNLSSQFFANVHLDALDQHAKHRIKARRYGRYVDDFYLLHESPDWLNAALADVTAFLPARLGARLNPRKTILQPVARGVDFVGHVIKPWRRTTRPRTVAAALARIEHMPAADVFTAGNSYLGLVRQASHSHHEQAAIARALRKRGHAVAGDLTKIFRSR